MRPPHRGRGPTRGVPGRLDERRQVRCQDAQGRVRGHSVEQWHSRLYSATQKMPSAVSDATLSGIPGRLSAQTDTAPVRGPGQLDPLDPVGPGLGDHHERLVTREPTPFAKLQPTREQVDLTGARIEAEQSAGTRMLEQIQAVVRHGEPRRRVGEVHDTVPRDGRVVACEQRSTESGVREQLHASGLVDAQQSPFAVADQVSAVAQHLDAEGPASGVGEFGGSAVGVETPQPSVLAPVITRPSPSTATSSGPRPVGSFHCSAASSWRLARARR